MEKTKRDRRYWLRTIPFWVTTAVICWEMVAGSLWDLKQIGFVRGVFQHLGYPPYLLLILGAWKLPGALVVLAPRLPRLKEWAYAGMFFNYSGAAASHLLAGDALPQWIGPAVFAGMTLVSYALRPADRRIATAQPVEAARPVAWAVTVGVTAAMVVLALLTLPKGS